MANDDAATGASAQMLACLPRLRRYARGLTGDRNAADDLVQDTFAQAWARISTWRPGGDMRAWLFGIMHNLHIDQRRRPALVTTRLDEEADLPTRAGQLSALEARDIEAALRMLSADQRQVLLLVALEGMAYEAVAQMLGIPLGTVMSRLSRARSRLRDVMEGRVPTTTLKVVR